MGGAVQIEGMPGGAIPGGVAMGGAVQIEGPGVVAVEAMPEPEGPSSCYFEEYRFVKPIRYSGYQF